MSRAVLSLSFAAAGLLAAIPAAQACKGTHAVFEDKFATLDPAWGNNDNGSAANNALTVKLPPFTVFLNQANVYNDGDFCVTLNFTQITDPASTQAGVVFWGTDPSAYWVFNIAPNGFYEVLRKLNNNGRWLYPISFRTTPAVKQGANQANEVEVVTKGNQATLYINGTLISTITGQPPDGGSLTGIYAGAGDNAPAVLQATDFRVLN